MHASRARNRCRPGIGVARPIRSDQRVGVPSPRAEAWPAKSPAASGPLITHMAVRALPRQELAPTWSRGRAVRVVSLPPDGAKQVLPFLHAAGVAVTHVAHSADDLDASQGIVVLLLNESLRARALRELINRLGDSRVVVVAPSSGSSAVRCAIDAGAAGFVTLEAAASTLIPSLDAVAVGQLAIPLSSRQDLQTPTLTTREKQVLALVVMGLQNGEIAAKLYLAESTVKSHLSSAFRKLGVRSRNEAAAVILDLESRAGLGILTIPTEEDAFPPDGGHSDLVLSDA
jgi:DNA-binding NarL/FixJ family response regulator